MIRFIAIILLVPFWLFAQDYKVLSDFKNTDTNSTCYKDKHFKQSDLDVLLNPNKNFRSIQAWGENDWDLEQLEWFAKENLSQYWVEPDRYADTYKKWLTYLFDEKQFALRPNNIPDDHQKFLEHLLPLYYAYHSLSFNNHLSQKEKQEFLNRLSVRTNNYFSFVKAKKPDAYYLTKCQTGKIWNCNNGTYKMQLLRTLYGATFNDPSHFDQGKKIWQIVINDLSEDNALYREAYRGKWSWMYYTHALNSLLSIAEIYQANGENLYDYTSPQGKTIHDAIKFYSDAIDDHSLMFKYAEKKEGIQHYEDWKNYKDLKYLQRVKYQPQDGFTAWLHIYSRRFPNTELTKKLHKQIKIVGKSQWGVTGFDPFCFYGSAK